MDVSNIGFSLVPPWSKETMNKMIEKFGKEEVIRRFAWLHETNEKVVEELLEQFLTDNFVDDMGVKGGHYFWGEL